MYLVLGVLSLFPLFVAARVLWVVVARGTDLRAQGEKQASSFVEIPAMRGTILDRAGRVLAVNVARYEMALDPGIEGFTDEVERTFFRKLSRLTGQPVSYFRRKVRQRSSPRYVMLLRDLSEQQKEQVETWEVPGVILYPDNARRYNYARTGAHVLGHVDADGRGIAGIELQFDEFLRGQPGRRAVKRDRLGEINAFVGGPVVDPRHGGTIVLTIDLVRQTILEEELAKGVVEAGANWGTAIAMDPHTGAVLAMANWPTYDPNEPGRVPAAAQRNHAITDRIEPGSTFKLVTAIAAVEKGAVRMDEMLNTEAAEGNFGGRRLRDTHAHERLSFTDAIVQSSNIALAKVGSRLAPGDFYQYARNLGFGQPTWIDLPGEVGGHLKKPSKWSGTTLSRMSIGYEVDVTPLQVLTAYCALANGGTLVRPYVVAERRDLSGHPVHVAEPDTIRRAFNPETAATLLPAFEKVVREGTAERALVPGLRVAGKTGTALKTVNGRYSQGRYRASFVGFFPADDPAVALIVVLDEPRNGAYGGIVSAPIFGRVAQRWVGTFPKVAERLAPKVQRAAARPAVPRVVGLPAPVARQRLAAAGFRAAVDGADTPAALVRDQQPAAGAVPGPGAEVRLRLGAAAGARTMPDVVGLSARQAAYWLGRLGVTARIDGVGRVVEQSPTAGAPLAKQAVLRCQ